MAGAEAIRQPLEILLVIGAAKLLGEIFARLAMPSIAGEILAGVVLGPSVLGWVTPNEFLTSLAELGVLFLLFRVGLEVRASELIRVGAVATLAAVGGVVLPMAVGWGMLRSLGHPPVESFFVGAAMVATSVGITAKVLSERGLLHARASRVILVAAVIDDVLGLLVLAVVSSMARGSIDLVELGTTAALAIGFVVVIAVWGVRAVNRVLPAVRANLRIEEADFVLALLILFALSALAARAGVAAIIGAFLAGMTLGESASRRVHDMTAGAAALLTPFFLVNIGLQIDLKAMAEPAAIATALLILVAAVLSKLIGAGLGAWRMGPRDALRVGVGMIPRGEVGMVVAQIGLSLGVIPQSVYVATVFMSVATTVIAPPLLAWTFRGVEPLNTDSDFTRD